MILNHWPDWYKDVVQAKFNSDKARLQEQMDKMVELGLWSADKAAETAKWAQSANGLQVSNAVAKMHRILRGR